MNISITSLGMLTSIGHDVVASCAAQRAGLTRPSPLAHFDLADVGEEAEGLTGHPIFPLTNGFYLLGLWVRIATESLRDLLRYGKLPDAAQKCFWTETAIIAAVPLFSLGRLPLPEDGIDKMLAEGYLQGVLSLLALPVQPGNLYIDALGHCATAQAIIRAKDLLARRKAERVIVLGVDSYTDRFSLEWLLSRNALKTSAMPVGAMPGEAGACFMLEAEGSIRARHAQVDAHAGAPVLLLQSEPEQPNATDVGRRLADAIQTVVLESGGSEPSDIYVDLNGEQWRAHAWGIAQVLLREREVLGRHREIVPCVSFGEVGAASGAIAVCLAARSFVRRYALGTRSIICSMNERGDVSAFPVLRQGK